MLANDLPQSVTLSINASDSACPTSPTRKITEITSNDRDAVPADMQTSCDGHSAVLMAERQASGRSRQYLLKVVAYNASGVASQPSSVRITVR